MSTSSRPTTPSYAGSIDIVDYTEVADLASTLADNPSSPSLAQLDAMTEPNAANRESVLDPIEKRSVTILLIGETGAGKTAFMSLLLNLFHGRGPFELEDWNDDNKESGLNKAHSQTTEATLYTVTTTRGTRIQILDTPGLADTRGIEQDKIHKAKINNSIQEFITSIDAVIIMANGTVERLSASTDYTLNVISSMFPHSIVDNIGFIFTNSDSLTWNFDLQGLQPELRQSPFWLVQNPLAMLKNYRRTDSHSQRSSRQEQRKEAQLRDCYEDTVEILNGWLSWLDERQVQPTVEIDRLYRLSMSIESHIDAAIASITRLSEQRTKYEKISNDLQKSKSGHSLDYSLILTANQLNWTEAKGALEALKKQQSAPVWCRESSSEPNTICLYPGCFSNCHTPCRTNITNDPRNLGLWCSKFKSLRYIPSFWSGKSTKCGECGHAAEHHGHYRQVHVRKPQGDPKIEEELESAMTDEERLEAAKVVTQRKLAEIKQEMAKVQDTIRSLVDDYNGISLSRNFAGYVRSAIKILELRREELKGLPNTDAEVRLIDESIEKFEQKLHILAEESSQWYKEKLAKAKLAVVRGAREVANLGWGISN